MTDEEIIKQAGIEWNQTRGDMNSYLKIIIRLARGNDRKGIMPWTRKEMEEFVELYPTTSAKELMERFGRSYRSIITKASQLCVKKDPDFLSAGGRKAARRPRKTKTYITVEAARAILEEYPHSSNESLAAKYNTSARAVSRLAQRNRVTKSAEYISHATREASRHLRKMYDNVEPPNH